MKPFNLLLLFASLHLGTAFLTQEEQKELGSQMAANWKFQTAIKAQLIIDRATVLALNRLDDPFFAFKDPNVVIAEAPKVFAVAIKWFKGQVKKYQAKREEDKTKELAQIKHKAEQQKRDLDAKWLVLKKADKMQAIDEETEKQMRRYKPSEFYEHMIAVDKECIGELEKLTEWAKELSPQGIDLERELGQWVRAKAQHKFVLYAAKQYGIELAQKPEGYLYTGDDLSKALAKAGDYKRFFGGQMTF